MCQIGNIILKRNSKNSLSYYIETADVTCINESGGGKICFCKRKKQTKWLNESFQPEPDLLIWIITMAQQWKSFFFYISSKL